ncbi:glycosyltransferase family 4 protein [Marinomonas mediterranea]|uniref:Glycosyl transferase group 1 n=1 Tax=Marinomonas mediterranea (strain ATCC 700492 / JCM 21426 / NBRC 103028 / MMB-1) TaxID=717774 RepID=F2K168_MARM1|nr:glycosyltransferase family 4 protein [Marinomonas mediterranea]ADZ89918.1 glycosyl transferase group 1 [Marinomonas mediterranea MMB-1]WCN08002.1 glycosyltransferase [Marinomonas mediterranea]WCN12097.1 glycosyltransferase [Marinomonas mediterranea]WCN16135.1 glycosyltransferase [Marinomonas mediterranea MMB-1]
MKIAIVHDWLVTYAGAERVLEQVLNTFPQADLYSIVDFIDDDRSWLLEKTVKTSFVQKLPFAKSKYRTYLPLMPLAIEQFDLSSYDLVISSSHAVAKGVITGPNQLHICMCYSPIRYAWDLQHQYLRESNMAGGFKGLIARYFLHKVRIWDVRTAHGVDHFISISNYISKRVKKVYGRQSDVIYPPVYVDDFTYNEDKEDYYITSSRMVPYKRIDLIVSTFSNHFKDKTLVVIGDGPEFEKIDKIAGDNVLLLGHQPFSVLNEKLSKAKAYIFAAEEDFGIAPLEAQACGTPVIAYGAGAALETIHGDVNNGNATGIFFDDQTEESLSLAINEFEALDGLISSESCRKNANRFSKDRFCRELEKYIRTKYITWNDND